MTWLGWVVIAWVAAFAAIVIFERRRPMTYNCHFPRCKVKVTMDGRAAGLKELGWKVQPKQGANGGTLILCPVHKGEQPLFPATELKGAAK